MGTHLCVYHMREGQRTACGILRIEHASSGLVTWVLNLLSHLAGPKHIHLVVWALSAPPSWINQDLAMLALRILALGTGSKLICSRCS